MTTPSTGTGVSRWTTTRTELIDALLDVDPTAPTAPEMADAILSRLTPAEAPELAGPTAVPAATPDGSTLAAGAVTGAGPEMQPSDPELERLRQMLDEAPEAGAEGGWLDDLAAASLSAMEARHGGNPAVPETVRRARREFARASVPAMADEIARLRHLLAGYADAAEEAGAPDEPVSLLPPPVADLGPVELELMGHRYRRGDLAEVVIAGTPFLRLTLRGGSTEFYRPDAVYCITPATAGVPEVQPALPAGRADDGDPWSSETGERDYDAEGPF